MVTQKVLLDEVIYSSKVLEVKTRSRYPIYWRVGVSNLSGTNPGIAIDGLLIIGMAPFSIYRTGGKKLSLGISGTSCQAKVHVSAHWGKEPDYYRY